jgi:TonB family protein
MDVSSGEDLGHRKVSIRRGKGYTALTTRCEVRGALVFVRTRRSGLAFWLARKLGLREASQFQEDISVYGVDNETLARLQADPEFNQALTTLFANKASRVTLGAYRIRALFPGRQPEAQEAASSAMLHFASRLEQLGGYEINSEASTSRLVMPFGVFCGVAYAAFFGAGIITNDVRLVTPFALLPATAGIALAIGGAIVIVIRPLLRKQALAAAVLTETGTLLCLGAIFSAAVACSITDISLGRRFIPDETLVGAAVPAVSNAKGHPCFMEFDKPMTVLGQTRMSLPISCKGFNKLQAGNAAENIYRIRVNPGLFRGGLFVDSVERMPYEAEQNSRSRTDDASEAFAEKVRQRVRGAMIAVPNPHDLEAVVEIHCAPDGTILSTAIAVRSGDPAIDDAALKSVRRANPMPPMPAGRDGKPMAHFRLTIRP